MTDAHIRRRVSMWLFALVVGSALSGVAEAQTLEELDKRSKQQQTQIEQLNSSVAQATKDAAALQRRIDEIDKRPADPEVWRALRAVGLLFVAVWGGIALLREWSRSKEIRVETEKERQAAINRQVQAIDAAATARIKALTELFREASQPFNPATAKVGGGLEALRDLFRGQTDASKGAAK